MSASWLMAESYPSGQVPIVYKDRHNYFCSLKFKDKIMEQVIGKKMSIFRGEEKIASLLAEFAKSKVSSKSFCSENNISSATFHNWKKRYDGTGKPNEQSGFAALQITPSADSTLFAEV